VDDLQAQVEAWIADDPDPATRAELAALLERARDGVDAAAALADLADRFAGTLEFGTAGLRGEVAAGPRRMNRAVVIRAAAGLAAWIRAGGGGGVAVGYDARRLSDVFARDTCAVMEAAGVEAMVLPRPLPTPVLAFAVRYLGADAGVMVTASHNPPADNGYKVYLGTGAQIAPPVDAEIAAQIAAVARVADVPRTDDGWVTLDDGIVAAYLDRAVSLLDPTGARDLSIVYTPLHGVGGAVVREAFTPRSPGPWTRRCSWPVPPARPWCSRTTRTPTAARSPYPPRTAPGGCSAATRSGPCWGGTCWRGEPGARSPTPSSPRRCSARSPAPPA
jgi:phosphomannomutase